MAERPPNPNSQHLVARFFKSLFRFRRKGMIMALLTGLARGGHHGLCARLLVWRLRRFRGGPAGENAKYKVIYLNKGGLNEDVEESLGADPRFAIFRAPRTDLQAIFAAFVEVAIADYSYLTNEPEVEAAKRAYLDFLGRFWGEVARLFPHDAVLSGNIVYHAEREFSAALEALGIPFICLHKECLKSPAMAEYFTERYRSGVGPFRGRLVATYNEVERQSQIEARVVPANRIKVVGMARLDRYHQWREEAAKAPAPAGPPRVLAFLFLRQTGLFRKEEKRNGAAAEQPIFWDKFLAGYLEALLALATKYPDIQVVLKSKGVTGGVPALQRQLFGEKSLPANLEIITGGDPFELITQSTVVSGFGSTSVLESLAAGVPVVVPLFEEAALPVMQPYIIDLGQAVSFAHSPAELVEKLAQLAGKPRVIAERLTAEQARVLDRWMGNGDGKSRHRVAEAVRETIEAAAHSPSKR